MKALPAEDLNFRPKYADALDAQQNIKAIRAKDVVAKMCVTTVEARMSIRLWNVCRYHDILTIGQLIAIPRRTFVKLYNVGYLTLAERDWLVRAWGLGAYTAEAMLKRATDQIEFQRKCRAVR